MSEVCATYEKEWNSWAAQLSDQSIDAGRASRQAYEIARRMADDLATIEPEGRVEAWRRAIKSLDEGLDAVGRENPPNIRHPEIRTARNALVDDFGADGCFA